MRNLINIIESINEWQGKWVHYSNEPFMKINPNPGHSDPLGIYFFPEKFVPGSFWKNKKYKFVCEISPNANILDLDLVSDEELTRIVDACGATEAFNGYITHYPPKDMHKKVDMAWEMMGQQMMMKKALWNKILRNLGYDAVFDDTKSIHTAETQLLVLNPKIIISKHLTNNTYSPYQPMIKVMNDVIKICEPYGQVEVEKPKKIKTSSWGNSPMELQAKVNVKRDDGRYVYFKLTHDPQYNKIRASIQYSRPSLGYGAGATYDIADGEYESFSNVERLIPDLEKIFIDPSQQ